MREDKMFGTGRITGWSLYHSAEADVFEAIDTKSSYTQALP